MRRWLTGIFALLIGSAAAGFELPSVSATQLPAEARQTLRLIDAGGPFPYKRDGIRFQNRERRLPAAPKGYYREYTVPTRGLSHRGPRRIVTGSNPPVVFYYTADHYQSFQRIER